MGIVENEEEGGRGGVDIVSQVFGMKRLTGYRLDCDMGLVFDVLTCTVMQVLCKAGYVPLLRGSLGTVKA